jgi:hypothetical protein
VCAPGHDAGAPRGQYRDDRPPADVRRRYPAAPRGVLWPHAAR